MVYRFNLIICCLAFTNKFRCCFFKCGYYKLFMVSKKKSLVPIKNNTLFQIQFWLIKRVVANNNENKKYCLNNYCINEK